MARQVYELMYILVQGVIEGKSGKIQEYVWEFQKQVLLFTKHLLVLIFVIDIWKAFSMILKCFLQKKSTIKLHIGKILNNNLQVLKILC